MVRESTLRLYVRSIVVAAFFAASAVFSAQADTWVAKNTTIETIDIANEITSGDAERLQNISRDLEYGGLIVVRLNSAGGDVTAAMSIRPAYSEIQRIHNHSNRRQVLQQLCADFYRRG